MESEAFAWSFKYLGIFVFVMMMELAFISIACVGALQHLAAIRKLLESRKYVTP